MTGDIGSRISLAVKCRQRNPSMFRFSIRELMLVTLVIVFGVAWFVEHRRAQAALAAANEASGNAEFWEQRYNEDERSLQKQLASYGLTIGYVGHSGPGVYRISPDHPPESPRRPAGQTAGLL